MSGVPVSVCSACGWCGFPARLWCPACGAYEVGTEQVDRGTVTDVTVVLHAVGRELGDGVTVAQIELSGGGSAIARLQKDAATAVTLRSQQGVPVAE